MILLEALERPLQRVLLRGGHYLIPRADGRVLVGSTLEHGEGFDERPTAGAIASLSAAAVELCPALAQATFVRAWAGLRPYAPRGYPYIGAVEDLPDLWVAAGHYRNGIGLAPITAEMIADQLRGRTPALDPNPFRPPRACEEGRDYCSPHNGWLCKCRAPLLKPAVSS